MKINKRGARFTRGIEEMIWSPSGKGLGVVLYCKAPGEQWKSIHAAWPWGRFAQHMEDMQFKRARWKAPVASKLPSRQPGYDPSREEG